MNAMIVSVRGWLLTGMLLSAALLAAPTAARGEGPTFTPDAKLVQLDQAIDWSQMKLLAVQHGGRYKTFTSYTREVMADLTGSEHLPGLSPYASALEWMFNSEAYSDVPIIRIKDVGIRMHLSAHMQPETRRRVRDDGFMTPREFLSDPTVIQRMNELMSQGRLRAAMGRVGAAHEAATDMAALCRIVPRPLGKPTDDWYAATDLALLFADGAKSPEMQDQIDKMREAGVTDEVAVAALVPWSKLRAAWLKRDAVEAQTAINELVVRMPTLSQQNPYPNASQRAAEAHYYAMGKFSGGWVAYFLAFIAAIWALATSWRTPRAIGFALLVIGLAFHAYGLALRWYILDRIPVANMFEAVVSAAWVGVVLGLVFEWFYRTGVFMVAGAALGFMALVMASFVLPGGGTITTIQMILDDVMLRIHTTLIISSYGLIFVGGVIAVCYLFGYYYTLHAERSIEMGIITGFAGLAMWYVAMQVFPNAEGVLDNAAGYVKNTGLAKMFAGTGLVALLALAAMLRFKAPPPMIGAALLLVLSCITIAIGARDFVSNTGLTLCIGGFAWSIATWLGHVVQKRPIMIEAAATGLSGNERLATPLGTMRAADLLMSRPILAGAAPGDEGKASQLPRWLHDFDWSHLIILNLVFVMLFVGIILGAMWADYSWGRPWGWDPKEVFAMNTWIIYAILIHTRFLVKNKGLWTAWLSVIGCMMMAFNWVYVNFFLVGLHSYA